MRLPLKKSLKKGQIWKKAVFLQPQTK